MHKFKLDTKTNQKDKSHLNFFLMKVMQRRHEYEKENLRKKKNK